MLLATRCPFCETVFRIQSPQLAARRGLVRCGHCQETFDASGSLYQLPASGEFEGAAPVGADVAAVLMTDNGTTTQGASPSLSTGTDARRAPPADSPASAPDNRPDPQRPLPPGAAGRFADDAAASRNQPASSAASVTPPEPELRRADWAAAKPGAAEPTLATAPRAASGADPEPHFSAPRGNAGAAPKAPPQGDASQPFATLSGQEDGAAPFAVTRETPARASRHVGWRIAGTLIALVLLVLLAAQLAWWLRETVMVYWPTSEGIYGDVCREFGCRVQPPRDIDGLQVEPSDLREIDDPHHLELRMPLRNRFGVALAYPSIELTLLDRQNNVVVRRVLRPQDYVKPGTPIEAGLPANATQTMIVRLDTGNVVASNFRLEIFYP
ncbi:hypothetical protein CY652_14740 [Burkholderia sp. WAC0059]|uniref:zinc-ribbon and DUF3426 domain-containing protein n=1 Tax=Burkholderia sp. WAC0059 TaxID=2066022 RepID=UPI000C7F0B81|nr:zinc-ribbon and DUF3426 domain-containing protein [Burkholderia sp. WAC0059]PLZ01632.1 hypothetical protein CY652_14740 [Burkholderia sp. WAC0059]